MKNVCKKWLALMLAMVMMLGAMPVAQAAWTSLEIVFFGLHMRDGAWQMVPLEGTFTVQQDGAEIGVLQANQERGGILTTESASHAQLIPHMDTMPAGYLIQPSGYTAFITEGRLNSASIMVFADEALFALQAEGAASFELIDAQGEVVLAFDTDDAGLYESKTGLPSGEYTLRQTAGSEPWPDYPLTLTGYTGSPESVVSISEEVLIERGVIIPTPEPTEVPTPEPTEEPTPEPTEEPTPEPTEEPTPEPTEEPTPEPTEEPTPEPTEEPTPEPTEEPTPEPTEEPTPEPTEEPTPEPTEEPTPEPTEEPTPEPTEEPTPEPTEVPTPTPVPVSTLVLEAVGQVDGIAFRVLDGEAVAAEGLLAANQPQTLEGLPAGSYSIEVTIPEGATMTRLNGFDLLGGGVMQWQAALQADASNLYQLNVVRLGSISGRIDAADGLMVAFVGEGSTAALPVEGGEFVAEGLLPGAYSVSVLLPGAAYEGEGWVLSASEQGVTATCEVTLPDGEAVALPELRGAKNAGITGVLNDAQGLPMAGAAVQLLGADGAEVASATTDDAGAFAFSGLESGEYTLRATSADGVPVARTVRTAAGHPAAQTTLQAAQPAELRLYVYRDSNTNGERGIYERDLPDVQVQVLAADSDTVLAEAVTSKKGYAKFQNLPAGQVRLRAVMPEGYAFGPKGIHPNGDSSSIMEQTYDGLQTSGPIDIEGGKTTIVAIGAMELAMVRGQVWFDTNADGIMQDGEPGQAGALIELNGTNNGMKYAITTDETGVINFDHVKPGDYVMRVTVPEGMMFTRYSKTGKRRSYYTNDGKTTDTRAFSLEAGKTFDNRWVGVLNEAAFEVHCYLDANYNGLYDEGELPLEGVMVEAIKQELNETVTRAYSGADGVARVGTLRANTFKVHAMLPEGYTYTVTNDAEGGNQFDSRGGRREFTVTDLVLGVSETRQLWLGAIAPATITGTAYLDDNFSGTRDDDEEVVSGIVLALYDTEGNRLQVERTNGRGQYTFTGVTPGQYELHMSAKRGYAFTKLGEGNSVINVGDGQGETAAFPVALGETVSGKDIGMILPGTVKGEVFGDANDNGLYDADEQGFVGAVVRLMDENGEVFSQEIGPDGAFVFDAVMPGRYYLRYELPEHSIFALIKEGGNTIAGNGETGAGQWFDFAVAQKVDAPLCGGLTLGHISGNAFADHNGSGVKDADEAALGGVVIELTPTRSDLDVVSTVSAADGSFAVTGLHPDDYTLRLTYPEGYVASRMDGVTLPVRAGNGDQSVALRVNMSDAWADQPLGGVIPASLRGMSWMDENHNGRFDEGEAMPVGETVDVIDQTTGNPFETLVIDENGVFATEGLIPGRYTLTSISDVEVKQGDTTFRWDGERMVMTDLELTEGDTATGMLLGVVRHTTLKGHVWADEQGTIGSLAGAEVTLMQGGETIQTVTTAEDGLYAFTGLMPGEYLISVALPEGRVVVEPGDPRLEAGAVCIMQECRGRTAVSAPITVVMNHHQSGLDIGSVLPGRLGDFCWLDLDGNGLQDGDEGGVPGVKIELMRGDVVMAETVSDQYGFYLFTDVYPAAYTLRVTAPAEVTATQLRTDLPMIVSVLEEGGEGPYLSIPVTVESDRANYDADLGFRPVKKDAIPAGYGEGDTQDWTKIKHKK